MEQNLHIDFEMRNNLWGKTDNQLQTIEREKKLICPWNHTQGCIDNFDPNRKFSNIFIKEVRIGSVIAIHASDNQNVLIVRVSSELKNETSNYFKIITTKTRDCGHRVCTIDCDHCHHSVIKVLDIRQTEFGVIANYMNENYCFENLYCYYRDIEIITSVHKNLFTSFLRNSIRRVNIYLRTRQEIILRNEIIYPEIEEDTA